MKRIGMAAAAAVALFTAVAGAHAADPNYGTPIAAEAAERTIHICESTRTVGVDKFDTVRFVVRSADGRETSFGWRFDTFGLPVVPLNEIAPAGTIGDRTVLVYVRPQQVGF